MWEDKQQLTRIGFCAEAVSVVVFVYYCYYFCYCCSQSSSLIAAICSYNNFAAHAHPTMQPQQHTHNNPLPAAQPQPLRVVHSPTIPPPNRGTRSSELAQGSKAPLTAPLPLRTTAATSPNRKRPTPLVLGKPREAGPEAGPEDWEIHQEISFAAFLGASAGMCYKALYPIEAGSL